MEGTSEEKKAKLKARKKGGRPKGSKTGAKHRKILSLYQKGMNTVEIAETIGVTNQQVGEVLRKWQELLPGLQNVHQFTANRPDILAAINEEVFKSLMKPQRLDGARVGELAKLSEVLHKQERLEKGLSTANSATIRYTKPVMPPSES